jgi:hypothetical protein
VNNIQSLEELRAQVMQQQAALSATPFAQSVSLPSNRTVESPQITEAQVKTWVSDAINQRMPGVQQRLASFDAAFAKALSAEDYAAFQQYVASGSPGFDALLASDKLYPLVQLFWETIRESTK